MHGPVAGAVLAQSTKQQFYKAFSLYQYNAQIKHRQRLDALASCLWRVYGVHSPQARHEAHRVHVGIVRQRERTQQRERVVV